VRTGKTVYVMTGPLYEKETQKLPKADEPHNVPSGYWKIICTEENRVLSIASFIFDQNTTRKAKLLDHLVTIDEIEKRSKLDFFWLLNSAIEKHLEKTINYKFSEKIASL
jgi:endonuclease G